MSRSRSLAFKNAPYLIAAIILCVSLAIYLILAPVSGADVNKQTLQVGDGQPGIATDYNISFEVATAGTLGSVKIEVCSNSPLVNRPCVAPIGFDISHANLVSQTGPGGFTISGATDANTLVLTRTASVVPVGKISFRLSDVDNPTSAGSYFARIYTYASNNASGTEIDSGGLAFSIANSVSITAEVPPYLIFCTGITITGLNCETASGDYIDFGELSSKKASRGSSQMLVASNAVEGHSITLAGTTLTSGNNIIPALSGGDISRPGVAQFGLNLRANSTPSGGSDPTGPGVSIPKPPYNQPNSFRFVDGDIVASTATPDDKRQFTVSYLVNVSATQPPGIYVSTVTYVCLANF